MTAKLEVPSDDSGKMGTAKPRLVLALSIESQCVCFLCGSTFFAKLSPHERRDSHMGDGRFSIACDACVGIERAP